MRISHRRWAAAAALAIFSGTVCAPQPARAQVYSPAPASTIAAGVNIPVRTSEAIDALTRARPTAAVISADVDESVVFCECAGISPSSLARGLAWVYPGIAEAASRRFTRVDIDWSAWSL